MAGLSRANEMVLTQECSLIAYRCAIYTDERDWHALADLFTEDAVYARPTAPDQPIVGRQAIYESFASRPATRVTSHIISNFVLTDASATEASGTCYATAYIAPARPSPDAPLPVADQILIGGFHDQFRYTQQGWRIAKRVGFLTLSVGGRKMTDAPSSIALIGFGEVGQTLARDLAKAGVKSITAWDIAFTDDASAQAKAAKALDVKATPSSAEALRGQTIIVCCVTAGSAEAAAATAAEDLPKGAFYMDVNSVSPGTKQRIAARIKAAGGRFIEASVMASIGPKGLYSPILIGGPHTAAFLEAMAGLNMDMKHYAAEWGKTAAVKMCRSVMVKGMEALLTESMIAAKHYGVEKDVIASLRDTIDADWEKLAGYMISRALIHGKRRAEEMRESARTVAEAGLEPLVTAQVAERQDWAGRQGALKPKDAWKDGKLQPILAALVPGGKN